VRGIGFKNVAKRLRRLEALCAGDLSPKTHFLLDALPHALDLKADVLQEGDPGEVLFPTHLPTRLLRPAGGILRVALPERWSARFLEVR
jgi:hypothetical protein